MAAYRFMTQYGMETHIDKIRKLYKHKSSLMINSLEKALAGRATITHPQGGLFLWCTLPDNVKMLDFCKKASENKVAVVPGIAFCVSPDDYCNSIRLNYSTPSDEQIVKGCEILGKVLDSYY
nr:MAG: hypothetical protein DIU81_01985 [[Clostridium] cellulosi]